MSEAQASPPRELWSSDRMFLLAVVGGAVGLGNIWRFPYIVGENGGGVFLLLYVLFVLLASLPLKMAEVAMGKGARGSPVASLRGIAVSEGASPRWGLLGWMMIGSALLVLTFYPVIGGWALKYVFVALFGGLDGLRAETAQSLFDSINANPLNVGAWHLLFSLITIFFVARGIRGGLEKVFKVAVPGLVIILLLLVVHAARVGDMARSLHFLFDFDFSKISLDMTLMALGQAFFSLGVGSGIFLNYASHAPPTVSVAKSMYLVGLVDTCISVLAGLAIFPFVFGFGLEPAAGPSLFFLTLPIAFGTMPMGNLVGALFFLLIFLAAISSSVGMLECAISRFKEIYPGKTLRIAWLVGGLCWLLGIFSVLSFNVLKDVSPLGFIRLFEGKNFFQTFDFSLSNIVLPLNGLLLAVFVGWVVSKAKAARYAGLSNRTLFSVWRFQLRFIVPAVLAVLIIFGLL